VRLRSFLAVVLNHSRAAIGYCYALNGRPNRGGYDGTGGVVFGVDGLLLQRKSVWAARKPSAADHNPPRETERVYDHAGGDAVARSDTARW